MSGIDAHAGMLGINVTSPGTLALITGTSTCQLVQSRHGAFDPGLWGPFEDAVIAVEWTLEAGQASTGGTVRWLLDLFGGSLPQGAEHYKKFFDGRSHKAACRANLQAAFVVEMRKSRTRLTSYSFPIQKRFSLANQA